MAIINHAEPTSQPKRWWIFIHLSIVRPGRLPEEPSWTITAGDKEHFSRIWNTYNLLKPHLQKQHETPQASISQSQR